jgi:glycosyltransferase involved in cell wall biosynthesis
MEFFYLTEISSFKFTDNKQLSIEIPLEAQQVKADNKIPANRIYFCTEIILPFLLQTLKQQNKENNLTFLVGNNDPYLNFLINKDLWFNRDKKINLSPEKISLAFIFDINSAFNPEFKNSLINGLNYLNEQLSRHFQDIEINVFTVYFSEWLEICSAIPLTNLLPLPSTLEKLGSHNVLLKVSNIVNTENQIDQEKIDLCLRVLNSPTTPNFTLNRSDMTTDRLREKEEHNSLSSKSPLLPVPFDSAQGPDVERSRNVRGELISIIIPTYNREKYLQEAVNSVINQSYKNFELIIVDDGSTDNTKLIIENYLSDSRIRYIYQQNKGISAARNAGIMNASGKYLMFLDDDDYYMPHAIEKLLAFIKKQPENVKMVYGEIILLKNNQKSYTKIDKLRSKPGLFLMFLPGCRITTPGQVIVETQVVKDVGTFDESYLRSNDYELWTKIILKYDIAKLEVPVMYYRIHEGQVTKDIGKIRYFSDKVALKLLYSLKANNSQLFISNNINTSETLALYLESAATGALNYNFTHYDTALELLKFSQEMHYSKIREDLISSLTANIPDMLRENFKSELRVSEAEKEILQNQALLKYG